MHLFFLKVCYEFVKNVHLIFEITHLNKHGKYKVNFIEGSITMYFKNIFDLCKIIIQE